MGIDTTCPHCSKPAKSAWSKILDGPLRVTQCQNCGKAIQLNISPLHFVVLMLLLLPAMWLPNAWLRSAAILVVGFGLSLFRALRFRYLPHIEPNTF
jgi:hypothetical protein